MSPELSAENAKLVTLARATMARSGSAVGAAVRDLDGRTYVAATVKLPSFRIDALDLAVAMAASSGASGLEAAAVIGETSAVTVSSVRDLGGEAVAVFVADQSGTVTEVLTT